MSTSQLGFDMTLLASADLSAKQFHIVKTTSTGVAAANATDLNQVGVLQDKPAAAGVPCNVRWAGSTKIALGGTVAAGDRLTSDANGKAIVAVTGKQVVGIATVPGVSGDIGTMFISPRGVV